MLEQYHIENESLPRYYGSSNASFGELLQGVSADGDDFLVTIPIDLHSRAMFIHDPEATDVKLFPAYKSKVRKFIALLAAEYKLNITGTFIVQSDIPEGKGLSSSTADMVATFRAIESFSGVTFDLEKVGEIFRKIEPSDGLLYPGSVIYKHRKCSFVRQLGNFPQTHIIAIDEGGVLDTISYNKVQKNYNEEDRVLYSLLQEDLVRAFSSGDITRIGIVATQSALLNQKFNNKKNLLLAISMLPEINASGIITTHSGTCIGILLNPGHENVEGVYDLVKNTFANDNVVLYKTM